MAISPGTRFGPYEIVDAIGAGGMGEVYRATDTKLGREVAIKTLPSSLAADTDRLARFEREAKLLATLNHPNIAVIYGLEEQDGNQCIAMELIEGETLEEKLKDGPLPVEDALRFGLQITQALEGAHDKGVVHRDLKPANVMVTRDGLVKVLDFGLAKVFSEDPDQSNVGQSPALSLAMTQQGIVLGTASYMSPEQASGQATDQRADVWAFGVVLFEMLSGLPLFTGESVPHILADVLKTEPDWNRLPKNLDPRLKQLLDRCLTKKPHNRYHAIADARIEIDRILSDPAGLKADVDAASTSSARPGLSWLATAIVLTAAITGLLAWNLRPNPEPPSVTRFDYDLPEGDFFRSTGRRVLTLSPNGRQFVYNASGGLHVRTMGELDARLIPGTELSSLSPSFSPDSQAVAYWDFDAGQLKRIAISGGAPVAVAEIPGLLTSLSWEADGTLLFAQDDGIYRVPATGGTLELVIPIPEGEFPFGPRLLPDGDWVLLTVTSAGDWDSGQIVAQSLSTGERIVLIEGGSDARYLPTGHLVYALADGLFAVAFDVESMTASGGAVPLVQGVMRATSSQTGVANYSVSKDGTLAYVRGGSVAVTRTLAWVDREGREESLTLPPRAYNGVRISPDGTKLALDVRDEELDIWTWDLTRETFARLTFESNEDEQPVWSPDGQRIAFSSSRESNSGSDTSLFWRMADGTGAVERLAEGSGQVFPTSFSPDATAIIVYGGSAGGGSGDDNIAIYRLDGDASVTPLLETTFQETYPAISPDGDWLAYVSNESGSEEIYVRPFPDVDAGRWQVSTGGGTQALWARNGQELFFRSGDAVMAVPVQTEPSFVVGNPEVVFEGNYLMAQGGPNYDVSLNGERFLMIKPLENASEAPEIIVVQNWFEELERLSPTE